MHSAPCDHTCTLNHCALWLLWKDVMSRGSKWGGGGGGGGTCKDGLEFLGTTPP